MAFHLVGGEIIYKCLGNNEYEITLTVYRDCNCTGCAELDNPAFITIFDANNDVVNNLSVNLGEDTQLPTNIDGLCLSNLPDVCLQRGTYITTVELPDQPGGYQIVYQRCCRNSQIINLFDPSTQGSTYVATIPDPNDAECNSSPIFSNYPPVVLCAGSPLIFDHSAYDLDGDSLVYSICEPYLGADNVNPQPNIASPPPYDFVNWQAPYNGADQLGGTPPLSISANGTLTGFPETLGRFVVGVCVSEYRNGVLLSTNKRDFQFQVEECVIVLSQAEVTNEDTIYACKGDDVQLHGAVYNADSFNWIPTNGLSNPDILNPIIFNIQQSTSYELSAINSLTECENIDKITIIVTPGLTANAGDDESICLGDNIQLNGSGGDSYSWTPTDGLNDPNIPNPIASPTQTTAYTLTVISSDGLCSATDQVIITVLPKATANAGSNTDICQGGSTQIGSFPTLELEYAWSPTTGLDDSNAANPIASPTQTTLYTLTVTAEGGCTATSNVTVTVLPFDGITVSNDVDICIGENTQLIATGGQTYNWLPISGLDAPDTANPTASPTQTTTYTVTVTNSEGCSGTAAIKVTVNPLPNANAGNDATICEGEATSLHASGGISYSWSPNNNLSNQLIDNPSASPSSTQTYTVEVTNDKGCKNTDEVTVNVIPVANAGLMTTEDQILCSGISTNVQAQGYELDAENNEVLAYLLHTQPSNTFGNILATNTTGIFSISDNPNIKYNTAYYISAVAGIEGNISGIPDLNNACLDITLGPKVIFLAPLKLLVNEDCDWEFTGDFTITVGVKGGYPQFNHDATYTLLGDINDVTLKYGETASTVFPEDGTNMYEVTASDNFGCPSVTVTDSFTCLKTPIVLLQYNGSVLETGNKLFWVSASEVNNDYYTLLRSSNGIDFDQIATIKGVGNSTTANSYQYLDTKAPNALSYYKLTQTDINGKTSSLGTISLQRGNIIFDVVSVTPIIATNYVALNFINNSPNEAQIKIYNTLGETIYLQNNNNKGTITQQIDVASWANGVYIVAISNQLQTYFVKIIKQ